MSNPLKNLEKSIPELLVQAIHAANDGFVITDYREKDNPIVFVNKAFEKMTGYSSSEILSRSCRFLQGEDRNQKGIEVVREAIKKGESCRVDLRNYRKDGTMFWNELSLAPLRDKSNQITHFVGVQKDITKQKQLEDILFSETREDPLTHLLNRRGLYLEAERMLEKKINIALILIDIDNFKTINDCYGHSKGDETLGEVARLLKERSEVTARYGGDEFVLLLQEKDSSLERKVAEIKERVEKLNISNKIGFPISLSIGVAQLPFSQKKTLEDAIREADSSMYEEKRKKKLRGF